MIYVYMRRVYFECVFNTRDARDAPRDASSICDFLINAACFSGHFSDLVGGGVSLVVIGRLAPRGGCVSGRDWSIGTSLSSPSDGAPLTGVSPRCDARVCVAHRRASCVPCVRAWTSSDDRVYISHTKTYFTANPIASVKASSVKASGYQSKGTTSSIGLAIHFIGAAERFIN